MKTLGLIGGTGPESTIDYYRLLTAQYREKADGASPPIIINSVDLQRMVGWMNAGELYKVTDYLAGEFEKLQRAGVDFAALTANTAHIVFDELQNVDDDLAHRHMTSRAGLGASRGAKAVGDSRRPAFQSCARASGSVPRRNSAPRPGKEPIAMPTNCWTSRIASAK